MGRHREKIDIIADVLKVANSGIGKTKIMYSANLSYTLLCKYLDLACNCGLLDQISKQYKLTLQGREFLKKYASFSNKREEIAKSILELNMERKNLEINFNTM